MYLVILLAFSVNVQGQNYNQLNVDEVYHLALKNNAGLKASALKVNKADALIGNAFTFDKTEIYYSYDENNIAINNEPLKVFGIQQSFLFPTIYFAGKKVNKASYNLENSSYDIQKMILKKEVGKSYYQLIYEQEKKDIYKKLDSFYQTFAYAAKRKFETGATNYLEKITAQAKQKQLQILYNQSKEDVALAEVNLKKLVQSEDDFTIMPEKLKKLEFNLDSESINPNITYFENRKLLFQAKSSYEKQQLLPDISLNYFQGSNSDLNYNLNGYQIGLKIPILFSGNATKIKASKISMDIANQEAKDYQLTLDARRNQLMSQLKKYEDALIYYEIEGKTLSEEIFKTAKVSYKNGEIDFFQYIQSLENAFGILLTHLNNLNLYNQTIIKLNYLTL